jgi:AraC-like DNA-binding protein
MLHGDSVPDSALVLALGAMNAANASLSALDGRCAIDDADEVLRIATLIARDRLGLQRVAFYVSERTTQGLKLLGAWGTGAAGELRDEHGSSRELDARDTLALRGLWAAGAVCVQRPATPPSGFETAVPRQLADAWVALTPLLVGDELLGVMYNFTALAGAPVEPMRQAAAALFCKFIALSYRVRRDASAWRMRQSQARKSPLVQHVLLAVDQGLPLRGHQLARELAVSPGHLARAFKREMGMSLVDYRNRKRIERFYQALQQPGGCSMRQAAQAAGFGSYAQFHRIHHKFAGSTPRRGWLAARGLPDLACSSTAAGG